MKTRNAIGSLLTLVSMGLSGVGAVELQDSIKASISDTLKICVTDVPAFGSGIYFDFPNVSYPSNLVVRPGNYFVDGIFPGTLAFVSDSLRVGLYLKESFLKQRFGISSNEFAQDLPNSFNEFFHEKFSFTRLAREDETDLDKFLDGYMK